LWIGARGQGGSVDVMMRYGEEREAPNFTFGEDTKLYDIMK
jgi:hypothetical protein